MVYNLKTFDEYTYTFNYLETRLNANLFKIKNCCESISARPKESAWQYWRKKKGGEELGFMGSLYLLFDPLSVSSTLFNDSYLF